MQRHQRFIAIRIWVGVSGPFRLPCPSATPSSATASALGCIFDCQHGLHERIYVVKHACSLSLRVVDSTGNNDDIDGTSAAEDSARGSIGRRLRRIDGTLGSTSSSSIAQLSGRSSEFVFFFCD